jgi:hypothetical protein
MYRLYGDLSSVAKLQSGVAESIGIGWRLPSESGGGINRNQVADCVGICNMGRIVPETKYRKIRELMYTHYRINYRIEEKQISILTVRHGKQILPADDIPA